MAERTYSRRYLSSDNPSPLPPVCSASSSICCLLVLAVAISGMGRHSWATPEQLEYLNSFVQLLPQAKEATGLGKLYAQVYDSFLKRWDPEPVALKPGTSLSPEELEASAKARLQDVSAILNPLSLCSHSPSASNTGMAKCDRRQSSQPSHTLNQHLAFSTYLASQTVRSLRTSSTHWGQGVNYPVGTW